MSHPRLRFLFPGFLVAAVLTAGRARAEEKAERNYTFSDDTAAELVKYKAAEDAKNYDQAVNIIDARLAKIADHDSYDYGMLQEYKAQALLQKGDFHNAIEPLETGLIISDAHAPTYSDERVTLQLCYYLAQLYFQEALSAKGGIAVSTPLYDKAEHYITRWVHDTKTPNLDGLTFYASLLYNRAIIDPDHPDTKKIELALQVVDQCLHLSTHPRDNLYALKVVCEQQLNHLQQAVDLLELLLTTKPENKTYWQELAALYLTPEIKQPVRAIVTFERAQALGLMNSPKDNYNLVGLYSNLGQYGHAAEILERDLRNGSIEDEQSNWILLSACYQQTDQVFKAIDALKEAARRYPKVSQLEYLIAQNYYSLNKNDEALAHLQTCIAKGGGTKPSQTYMFIAYVAYQLQKYDVALGAANKALEYPDAHDKAASMKRAVESALLLRADKLKKM